MRWVVVAVVYGVLVFFGWAYVQSRQPVLGLVALRALEPGELLRDIAPGDGAYAKRRIAAGEPIKAGDFVAFPALTWADNTALLALTVARSLIEAGDVNGGKLARLCPGSPTDTVTVQAVFCTPTSAACIALAPVPAAKLQPYAEAIKAAGAKSKLVRVNANC
jgi:hypothetical protein